MERPAPRQVGIEGEATAAAYLAGQGYQILERNVRFRAGEIDLVALHQGMLVFVEVKTRRTARFGRAIEAVTAEKQRRLLRLAALYLARRGGEPPPCRFDVVTVEPAPGGGLACQLIQGAFTA